MWVAIVLTALFYLRCSAVDLTREERAVGADVVQAVDDLIRQSCIFPDDALFLRRIAYVETRDGENGTKAFTKNGADYYGGIWRVDEAAFDQTKTFRSYFSHIETTFGIDWRAVEWMDLVRPLYSGLAARLYLQAYFGSSIPRSIEEQADVWRTRYRTDESVASSTFVTSVEKLVTECSAPRADIVIVLDSSGSIGANNYILVKQFIAAFVARFDIGQDAVRVGLIKFSTSASVEFKLDTYTDAADVAGAILSAPYESGKTNSAAALLLMKALFEEQGRGELGVPEIGIFLTDGKSTKPGETVQAAQLVHDTKLTVFGVGITSGVDMDELRVIGSDPDCVHVYHLDSFTDVTHFTAQIEQQACKAPAELPEGEPATGELVSAQEYFFKVPVKKKEGGCSIQLDMLHGAVDLYLSWSVRNPGRPLYDIHHLVTADKGIGSIQIPWKDDSEDDSSKGSGSGEKSGKASGSSKKSGSAEKTGKSGSGEKSGKSKGSGEDESDEDEVRELFGTLVGRAESSAYQLQYRDGWFDSGAAGLGSLTLTMLLTLLSLAALLNM